MSFVCTRMYPYVTRMYSYVIRMYSYVPVCYSYVTRMLLVCHSYVLVCIRMLLVELVSCLVTIGATHLRDCLRKEVGRSPNQCSRNDCGESLFILNHLCSIKTNCFSLWKKNNKKTKRSLHIKGEGQLKADCTSYCSIVCDWTSNRFLLRDGPLEKWWGDGGFSACTIIFFRPLLVQEIFLQVKPLCKIFFFRQLLCLSFTN